MFASAPSAPPENIRCTALGSQSLQINWQSPPIQHCNGIIQGYKILYDTQDPGKIIKQLNYFYSFLIL